MKFLHFLIFVPVIVLLCLVGVVAALCGGYALEDLCERQLDSLTEGLK
ncbi:MAG TPA: hypothetical protein VK742_20345 [Candidatus Sulfotelmatobacter sp.]|jgi:hypothetical protein|nr:hypothetical protein [Candidatus Sulfotelmatobacter sp.]